MRANSFSSLTVRRIAQQLFNWHDYRLPPNHFHHGEHARGGAGVGKPHNRSLYLNLTWRHNKNVVRIRQENVADRKPHFIAYLRKHLVLL